MIGELSLSVKLHIRPRMQWVSDRYGVLTNFTELFTVYIERAVLR